MAKVIVIAGGAGFIGSHVSTLLVSKDNNVICIDSLTTSNKRNIKTLLASPHFTFVEGDIVSKTVMNQFKNTHIDHIYHLASPASVEYITSFPVETALVNSIGTKNVLDLAREKKARIVFASSSEIYGDPKQHPQKETYWGNVNSIGVRSGYDEGKRFGEALCMAYHRQFSIETRIARIFNTYGPYASEKDTRVIPQLIMQALWNKPLTVHGDGKQTRSFCYVSDTADGLIKVMASSDPMPFNIGSPDEYKILDIPHIILKLTQSKSNKIFTKL